MFIFLFSGRAFWLGTHMHEVWSAPECPLGFYKHGLGEAGSTYVQKIWVYSAGSHPPMYVTSDFVFMNIFYQMVEDCMCESSRRDLI